MARLLFIVLSVLSLLACSGGGGGGEGGSAGPAAGAGGGGGGGGGQLLPASARLALRVPANVPGAQPLAYEPPALLAWLAQPAFAQTVFYTLPGARVDAFGLTFAIADDEGVATFRSLPPGPYRFIVSTSDPGVRLQTLLTATPGATLDSTVDPFTTMATLTALAAGDALAVGFDGVDLEALADLYEAGTNPQFAAVANQVQANLVGSTAWLDDSFRPTDPQLQQALRDASNSVTYVLSRSPNGLASGPSEPFYLILIFNRPVDPATLPPFAEGWTLQTPFGEVNAANLSQFGSAAYVSQATDMDGRAFPPNSFYFRFPGRNLPANTPFEFTLSLPQLPRTPGGETVLSSRPAGSFGRWSFALSGNDGSMVPSNITGTLTFNAEACNGPTSADLSPIAAPALMVGHLTPNFFFYEYYQHEVPFSVPGSERVFFLKVRDADIMHLGDVYQVTGSPDNDPGFRLVYEEREYTDPNSGPTTFRDWIATSGTLTIVGLEGGNIRFRADVVMEPMQPPATGSFCLEAIVDAVFP